MATERTQPGIARRGRATEGYRNHAHRVYNFARSIASLSRRRAEWDREVALMIAFHPVFRGGAAPRRTGRGRPVSRG